MAMPTIGGHSMVTPLASDVAAFEKDIVGIGGAKIVFEEEAFDVGMRHNAMDAMLADADDDGMLDFDEFCRLIKDREEGKHSVQRLKERFQALDSDGSGKVDMSEYLLWSLRDALIRSSQRVLDLFQEWDEDGSGSITKAELRRAVEAMGFPCGKREVDALFKEIDDDDSGRVDYLELNKMLRQGAGSQQEGGTGRSPFVSPRSQAPRDRQGWSQNRRALKRSTERERGGGATGRGRGPLAYLQLDFDAGGRADGTPPPHPVEQLRMGLAENSTRVVDLFKSWDTDGNGQVDRDEFRSALFSLGVDQAIFSAHVDGLFEAFDKDGSGSIEYKEMHRMLRKDASLDAAMLPGGAGAITMESKNKNAARAIDVTAGKRRMGLQADLLEGVGTDARDDGGGAGSEEIVVELLRKSLARNWTRVRELFR